MKFMQFFLFAKCTAAFAARPRRQQHAKVQCIKRVPFIPNGVVLSCLDIDSPDSPPVCVHWGKMVVRSPRNGFYFEKGVDNAALRTKNYIPSNDLDR